MGIPVRHYNNPHSIYPFNLYVIQYEFRSDKRQKESVVCAKSELDAATIIHDRYRIGGESIVTVFNVVKCDQAYIDIIK